MPVNPIRTRFRNNIDSAISEARNAGDLAHPGMTGIVRELIVEKLLRPIVPAEVQFGTGKLVDSSGSLSSQIDIVAYAPEVMPPFLHDARNGLFPIESCLYAIEVKSMLSSSTLKSSVENAKNLRSLKCIRTEYWVRREVWNGPTPHPISALFAFESDLRGPLQAEISRYSSIDSVHPPAIGVFCIAKKGYFYDRSPGKWATYEDSGGHEAILGFLAGIANTIPQLMNAKGRPKFGHYLIDEPIEQISETQPS